LSTKGQTEATIRALPLGHTLPYERQGDITKRQEQETCRKRFVTLLLSPT
jgi:transposase